MASLPPDDDQLLQIREAIARLFERLRGIEARLERLEEGEPVRVASPATPPARETSFTPPGEVPAAGPATEPPLVAEVVTPEISSGDDATRRDEPPVAAFSAAASLEKKVSDTLSGWTGGALGARSSSEQGDDLSWEQTVGSRWLTWAGAATLVVAIAFTVHWAWKTLETPDWVKVSAFHALGLGLLAAGFVLRKRDLKVLSQGLSGLGVFTLYAIAFATLRLYHIGNETTAFVECALITAGAVTVAVRTNSVAVILLGALGGYLTPLVITSGSGRHVELFVYLAFLNVALIGSAVLRGWNFLKPIALIATGLMFATWVSSGHFHDQRYARLWSTEWLLAVHAVIFLIGTTLPPLAWRRPSDPFDVATLTFNSLFFVGMTWWLFREHPNQQMAFVCWAMSILHLGLFALTWSRLTNADRMPRVHLALAAVFFTLAVPLQLDDFSYLAPAWCVEALAFTAVGLYFRDRQMVISALIAFALAAARLIGWEYTGGARPIEGTDIDMRLVLFASCGALMAAAGALYWLLPRLLEHDAELSEEEQGCGGALLAGGNLLLMMGVMGQWETSRLVLVIWALDAALLWAVGFYFDWRPVRWYAAALGVLLVGGRLIYHLSDQVDPFHLLANTRFATMALVAAIYFAAGWSYRRRSGGAIALESARPFRSTDPADEDWLDPLLGVLGNVVLLGAITLEIGGWYDDAAQRGWAPYADMNMARQATFSIVWALYAAAVVLAGFLLRYRLFRLLGLIGFVPIVAKVFLVDLANLQLLPRVLALAVLGMALLGVSFLYQKFASRIGPDEPPAG